MTRPFPTASLSCEGLAPVGVPKVASRCRPRGFMEGAMSTSSNERLVRRAIEAIWNRGDLDVADELFAPHYVNHDGVIADVVLGPEAIKVSAALHRLAFPDLHVTIEELGTADDIVVLHWSARRRSSGGTEDGVFTPNRPLLTGITRSRLTDGKIMESWSEWNKAGVFRDFCLASGATDEV
jgi:hypothetical protein